MPRKPKVAEHRFKEQCEACRRVIFDGVFSPENAARADAQRAKHARRCVKIRVLRTGYYR